MRFILSILICLLFTNSFSQKIARAKIVNGDTIPIVELTSISVCSDRIFKNAEDEKTFYQMVHDVKKVYPYAIMLSIRIKEINSLVSKMSKRQRRIYVRKVEPEIKEEFEIFFKSNTTQQAQILIKLVNRETGNTSYELIRHFSSGMNAIFWQSFAFLSGTNLKEKYDSKGKDKVIEDIIKELEYRAAE
jgi:hypothetical protein